MQQNIQRNNYLVLSSALWLIPGTYVLLYKQWYIPPITTYSVSIASMNYWRNPTKENLFYDQLTATIGCTLYIGHSLYYIPSVQLKGLAVSSVVLYYSVYCLSCHLYKANNKNWFYCHILFHVLIFWSKWILYLNIAASKSG